MTGYGAPMTPAGTRYDSAANKRGCGDAKVHAAGLAKSAVNGPAHAGTGATTGGPVNTARGRDRSTVKSAPNAVGGTAGGGLGNPEPPPTATGRRGDRLRVGRPAADAGHRRGSTQK